MILGKLATGPSAALFKSIRKNNVGAGRECGICLHQTQIIKLRKWIVFQNSKGDELS
jgi:hypothetical protein